MITRCSKRNSIVVLLLLLCGVGATYWSYSYSSKLQNELHLKKEEIALHEVQKKDSNKAETAAQAAEDDKQLLEEYFLTENETVAFLTDLENSALADGVVMETKTLLMKDDKKLPYIELSLSCTGSQESLGLFLERLENLHYSSWIDSLHWSKKDSEVSAEVNLKILLLPS